MVFVHYGIHSTYKISRHMVALKYLLIAQLQSLYPLDLFLIADGTNATFGGLK